MDQFRLRLRTMKPGANDAAIVLLNANYDSSLKMKNSSVLVGGLERELLRTQPFLARFPHCFAAPPHQPTHSVLSNFPIQSLHLLA
jgi:hypothetical protein